MAAFPARAAAGLSLALALLCAVPPLASAQAPPDGVAALLRRIEQAALAGDRPAFLGLGDSSISRPSFEEFASTLTTPRPTRIVAAERDRVPLDGGALRLVVEIFVERGIEGRLGTWQIDVRPLAGQPVSWRIAAVGRLSVVTGLYRLSLNSATEYDIHDLTVRGPDLEVHIASGRGFIAQTPEGPTALVVLGRGRIHFSPAPPAERTQVRIFAGHDDLELDIDLAFLRFSPYDFTRLVSQASLRPRPVVASDARAATTAFNDLVGRSLQVDLGDISRERWSLVPPAGDLIAEMRTRKLGTLTYTRSTSEPEDISFFDRKRRRNISLYTSAEKLQQRGRFYSEDERLDYDVLEYDIDAQFHPERAFVDGNARLRVKLLEDHVGSLTFKLADSVNVRGVYSPDYGRLLHLRVVGQNSVIVNLPAVVARGTELWLNILYSGMVAPQSFDREAIHIEQSQQQQRETIEIPLEQRYLYSNRSYWYPQSTVTDYATAHLRITVPSDYDVVASGEPASVPAASAANEPAQRRRKTFVFAASRPARYLALIISRFTTNVTSQMKTGAADVSLHLRSTPRAPLRRDMDERTAAVFSYYASLVGDAPYPSFTLALLESELPGGHSPPYFAVLNQVVPGANLAWRNDPVSFDNYPTFFLAHEVAHQWWGHAVGWKNYHEQWLSEGLAQYFAALYAEKEPEGNVLPNLLRQMRHTAIQASSQGPIYLGYRLGHIQGDDRIFRAIVYNKAAMVLHMLRRLIGDEAFFGGVREFYGEWKFRKAGTDDFRVAMEKTSGRNLERFFETWVFGAEIPRLKFGYQVKGSEAVIHFDQHGDGVDVPITVTIAYTNGSSENILFLLADKHTERTLALKGAVRTMTANADNAALVEIVK